MLLVLGQENLTSGTSPALTAACTSSHIQSWQESISNPSRDDTGTESFVCVNRDFPYGLRPTTVVDLSDEAITDREIGKHFPCLMDAVWSQNSAEYQALRWQAVALRPCRACWGRFAAGWDGGMPSIARQTCPYGPKTQPEVKYRDINELRGRRPRQIQAAPWPDGTVECPRRPADLLARCARCQPAPARGDDSRANGDHSSRMAGSGLNGRSTQVIP